MKNFKKNLSLSKDNLKQWIDNFNLLYHHISGVKNHLKYEEIVKPASEEVIEGQEYLVANTEENTFLFQNKGAIAEELLNYTFSEND